MRYDEDDTMDFVCEDLRFSGGCLAVVAVLAALITIGFICKWLLTV